MVMVRLTFLQLEQLVYWHPLNSSVVTQQPMLESTCSKGGFLLKDTLFLNPGLRKTLMLCSTTTGVFLALSDVPTAICSHSVLLVSLQLLICHQQSSPSSAFGDLNVKVDSVFCTVKWMPESTEVGRKSCLMITVILKNVTCLQRL